MPCYVERQELTAAVPNPDCRAVGRQSRVRRSGLTCPRSSFCLPSFAFDLFGGQISLRLIELTLPLEVVSELPKSRYKADRDQNRECDQHGLSAALQPCGTRLRCGDFSKALLFPGECRLLLLPLCPFSLSAARKIGPRLSRHGIVPIDAARRKRLCVQEPRAAMRQEIPFRGWSALSQSLAAESTPSSKSSASLSSSNSSDSIGHCRSNASCAHLKGRIGCFCRAFGLRHTLHDKQPIVLVSARASTARSMALRLCGATRRCGTLLSRSIRARCGMKQAA